AELQRVSGHYGADFAIAEFTLDLTTLARQVPAAIPAHALARNRPAVASVLEISDQDLGGQPVIGEDQRLQPVFDELERETPRLRDVAAANTELPIHHRRIVEDEKLLAPWRAVAIDQFEPGLRQRLGKL